MSSQPDTNWPDTPGRPRDLGCYVYGVVSAYAGLPPRVMGLDDGHEVFLIESESIAAVASLVSLSEFGEETLEENLNDLAWLERQARRHQRIVDRVGAQTTLVPMRLFTIYRDEQSVREMLARENAFLTDALNHLKGRTEWGVKLYVVSDPSEAAIQNIREGEDGPCPPRFSEGEDYPPGFDERDEDALGQPPLHAPGPGASYLMQRQQQDRRREDADALIGERCEMAHSELAQAAIEAKTRPVHPSELTGRNEPMVFNGVYLVDDATLEDFTAIVRSLDSDLAETGLELELTGPWTPYNFVENTTEVDR